MKHYLVTRFNLQVPHWQKTRSNSDVRTRAWMTGRLSLFRKYCLPSVMQQRSQKFKWLVFFDTATSVEFRPAIDEVRSIYPRFQPLFVNGIKSMRPALIKYISEHLVSTDTAVITTRLDNDDILHHAFIGTIQSLAIGHNSAVIDLQRGYQLDISGKISACRECTNAFNPFISLVEPPEDPRTVYAMKHSEWAGHNTVICYDQEPLWIELVHDSNVQNIARPGLPLRYLDNPDDFGLITSFEQPGKLHIKFNNALLHVKRLLQYIKQIFSKSFTRSQESIQQ